MIAANTVTRGLLKQKEEILFWVRAGGKRSLFEFGIIRVEPVWEHPLMLQEKCEITRVTSL